jgi:hypothetical protein
MTIMIALIAGYFGLLIVLSLIARPSRHRLSALAHDLSCEEPKSEHLRFLRAMLDSAYSMRSAPAHLAAVIIQLLTPSEKFDRRAREWAAENRNLVDDPRWREVYDRYIVSIVAANPIFGALLVLARAAFRLKAHLYFKRLRSGSPKIDTQALELYGELKAAAA